MISFEHVSKRYRLGAGHSALYTALCKLPNTFGSRGHTDSEAVQELWALRDVTFRVNTGEALGIVGRNGAGKTTILKLLSRITQPTSGRIDVDGRVAALIELGAGFHPDLTGIDNVYLYGAILGVGKRELDRKLQSIVDFAELHSFMDTPVKRYSSGMYARLAFSVAAHIEPDVLLVDEVLSVGDTAFQQKCFEFIHRFSRSGRTTVFISHSLYVEQLCDRLVWLDQGRIMEMGHPGHVLEKYLNFVEGSDGAPRDEREDQTSSDVKILGMQLHDDGGLPRSTYMTGENLTVSVKYESRQPLRRPHFCIWVTDTPSADRVLFAANMILDGCAPEFITGRGTIRCVFRRLPLLPRTYYVWLEIYDQSCTNPLFIWQRLAAFRVVDPKLRRRIEGVRGAMRFARSHAPFRVDYEWQEPDGRRLGSEDDPPPHHQPPEPVCEPTGSAGHRQAP